MSTTSAASPSSATRVGDALMALHGATEHPFDMTFDGERFIATFRVQRPDGSTFSTTRYSIRLLPATAEYRRLMTTTTRTTSAGPGTHTYNSRWITKPVDAVLAAHGWKPRRTVFGRLFRRMLAMPS
jgi:hypothetical protein